MARLTASPATLGVPKEHQTLPSVFLNIQTSFFSLIGITRLLLWKEEMVGVITALVIRICLVYFVNRVTTPVGFLPAQLPSFLEKGPKGHRWK